MERDGRIEELRSEWGPPPTDLMERSAWGHLMELLADLPDVVAAMVSDQGTDHPTLLEVFGKFLPDLEAEVTWRYVSEKLDEDVLDAARDVLRNEVWGTVLHGRTSVQRTRLAKRLADDVNNNIARVWLDNPPYRNWLIGDGA